MAVDEKGSEVIEHSGDYSDSLENVEDILEADSDSVEWVPQIRDEVIDEFIYTEIISEVASDFLDRFSEEVEAESEEEVLEKIKKGEIYDRLLELGVEKDNIGEEAFEGSIFEDEVGVSDALGIDYALRGGKRLRPAVTILTDYALNDEVSYRSAMIGAAIELVHSSSLIHDDEMDGDFLRRTKLSSERVNNAFHKDKGWMHSVLDGNKVEAWANKAIVSITGASASDSIDGIPNEAAQKFFDTEVELNDGQKRDLSMEDKGLRDTDLEEYKSMIEGKTGALYEAGVEMVLEDHFSRKNYDEEEEAEISDLFDTYVTNFNILFQAGDDAIEVFRPEEAGKSVTDIENRKSTFPALVTEEELEQTDKNYAELYLDIFDQTYDGVTQDMREIAEDMGLPLPDNLDEEWEDQWLTDVINTYGEQPSNTRAEEYLNEAMDALDTLYGKGVINEAARDHYSGLAEFVWNRDH